MHGHAQDVKAVIWHPSKELLASCSYDDTIKLWEEEDDDWSCSETLCKHTSTIWDISFNADGSYLASCSDDKSIIIWKAPETAKNRQWEPVCILKDYHRRAIYSITWCKQKPLIATGGGDDGIRIFKQMDNGDDTWQQYCVLEQAHNSDVNCVRWNPAEPDILASCSDDNEVVIWKLTE